MSTTNGTKSLQKVQNAKHLFAMGLPNRKAVAQKISQDFTPNEPIRKS